MTTCPYSYQKYVYNFGRNIDDFIKMPPKYQKLALNCISVRMTKTTSRYYSQMSRKEESGKVNVASAFNYKKYVYNFGQNIDDFIKMSSKDKKLALECISKRMDKFMYI